MTKQELNELYIKTHDGIFTPVYTFESYDTENQTYIGLEITKTSDEVYREWLEKKDNKIDNCPPQPPSNEDLNNQLIETQKLCLSLQKQILLK